MRKIAIFFVGILGLGFFLSCEASKNTDLNSNLKYDIERIEYFTSVCFGPCPQFRIEIGKNRDAVYEAIRFNFTKEFNSPSPEGSFKAKINENNFQLILKKLNDMDFPTLEDRYKVQYTDAQTANLKIIYDGGKEKTITDYGMMGTPELKELYQLFLELRENQNWEKIK